MRILGLDVGTKRTGVAMSDALELDSPRRAQRGDVVLIDLLIPRGIMKTAVGICVGAQIVFAPEDGGAALVPIDVARRAWRV